LDPNSTYAYLLLCRDFAGTCVVASASDDIAGMVTAYRPPEHPEVLFVWQIAVATSWRGRGLAQVMLDSLLDRPALSDVRFIETTIGPNNTASQQVFRRLATRRGLALNVTPQFAAEMFPAGHEAEFLYRLGPIASTTSSPRS
jgi:L-2,4-diaminobutyric acid acetyltransferase